MKKPKQVQIGDSVEFQGGWYRVEDIVTIPNIAGSMPFLKLKDLNNPVPMLHVQLIKQQAS